MTMSNLILIRVIAFVAMAVGALIGTFNWRLLTKPIRVFTVLLLIHSLSEIVAFALFKNGLNPNLVYHTKLILELALLLYFYFLILGKPIYKMPLFVVGAIAIAFFVLNLLFIQKNNMNSYSVSVLNITTLTLGITYFYSALSRIDDRGVSSSIFWISSGLLIQSAGMLFLFIVSDYLINVLKNDMILYTGLNSMFQIFVYVIFGFALWLGVKEGKLRAAESRSS